MTIYQGDSYETADARNLDWNGPDWPTLTALTPTLRLSKDGAAVFSKAGTVVNGGAETQTVRIQLTSAETLAIEEGTYDLRITVVSGGKTWTLVDATASVRQSVV